MEKRKIYNYSEEHQRKAYINFKKENHIKLIKEVPVLNRCVDLVILEKTKKEITAIEFKLKQWKKALEQALKLTITFDYIMICVMEPKKITTKSLIITECKNKNIGLIFSKYKNNIYEFYQVLEPFKQSNIWIIQKQKILKLLKLS
ncbi:MAG: hypothetical protein H9Q65_03400 [Spiroplasma ixodetis]|nr:hypothetical protein [Spiroplasma ixodetis]MBP1528282.1 hypothetical protein [Spiroplasma ixodetis]